jgi:excisionase family DNA binding protein
MDLHAAQREAGYVHALEAVGLYGVSLRTLRRWIADGALPSRMVLGRRYVDEAALRERLGLSRAQGE